MRRRLLLIVLALPCICFAQLDSLRGKVSSVRERVEFFDGRKKDAIRYNPGSNGFVSFLDSKAVIANFEQSWFNTSYVLGLDYSRHFAGNGYIVKESWTMKPDSSQIVSRYVYNSFGKTIQAVNQIDAFEMTTTYIYDGNGSLLEKTQRTNVNSPLSKIYSTVYTYDKNGNRLTSLNLSGGEKSTFLKFAYDKFNRKIADSVRSSVKYNLMANGDEEYQRTDSGVTYLRTKYDYYDSGQLRNQYEFEYDYPTDSTTLDEHIQFFYDKAGKLITKISGIEPNYFTENYIYNEKQQLITVNGHNKLGVPHGPTITYRYTKLGYPEIVRYMSKEESVTISFQYKFDSTGNWIEQSKYLDGKLLAVRKRTITYY